MKIIESKKKNVRKQADRLIKKEIGVSNPFCRYQQKDCNSIAYFTFLNYCIQFNNNPKKVFYLPIIIDNPFCIIYGNRTRTLKLYFFYDSLFLSHWDLVWI